LTNYSGGDSGDDSDGYEDEDGDCTMLDVSRNDSNDGVFKSETNERDSDKSEEDNFEEGPPQKKHKNKKHAQTKKNKKAPTKETASSKKKALKKKQKGKQKNTQEDDRKEQFAQAYNNIPPKSTKKQRIEIRLRACVKYDLYPPELKKCIEECDTGEWSPAKIHATLKKNAVNFGVGLKMVLKGLTNLNKR
jgi:flagellar biosynthesis GTPase FlhF